MRACALHASLSAWRACLDIAVACLGLSNPRDINEAYYDRLLYVHNHHDWRSRPQPAIVMIVEVHMLYLRCLFTFRAHYMFEAARAHDDHATAVSRYGSLAFMGPSTLQHVRVSPFLQCPSSPVAYRTVR